MKRPGESRRRNRIESVSVAPFGSGPLRGRTSTLRLVPSTGPEASGITILDTVIGEFGGGNERREAMIIASEITELLGKGHVLDHRSEEFEKPISGSLNILYRLLSDRKVVFETPSLMGLDAFSMTIMKKILDEDPPFRFVLLFDLGRRKADNRVLFDRILHLVEILVRAKMWEESAVLIGRLKRMKRGVEDEHLLARFCFRSGMIETRLGEESEALKHFKRGAVLFESSGDKAGLLRALNNLGNVLVNLDKPEGAREVFQRALRIAEEEQDDFAMGIIYSALGKVNLRLDLPDEARDSLFKAGVFIGRSGYMYRVQLLYVSMGDLEMRLGRPKRALPIFRKALRMASMEGARMDAAVARLRISLALSALGRFADSMDEIARAREIFEGMGNRFGIMMANESLADLLIAKGERKKARDILYKCLASARRFGKESRIRRIRSKIDGLRRKGKERKGARGGGRRPVRGE